MAPYFPAQGDLVALTFDPQSGQEQAGRRPALVVSVRAFNSGTGLAICCPITNSHRNWPFHGAIPATAPLAGFVMCEQVKSIDCRARTIKFVERAPTELVDDVLAIRDASIYPAD